MISWLGASDQDSRLLLVRVAPENLQALYQQLPTVAARLVSLAAGRFKRIQVNGEEILTISSLLCLAPAIEFDELERAASIEQAQQEKRRYRALLTYTAGRADIAIVSTSGVYKDVHFRPGALGQLKAEDMVDRPIDAFLSVDVAARVRAAIREAYKTGRSQVVECLILGAPRRAEFIPVAGAEEVIVALTSPTSDSTIGVRRARRAE